MKISSKGRYALRLMLDLALNYNGGYTSIRSIAERQGISEKYLEQIISGLSRAKLVKSIRGAGGGYMLVKQPEQYTVGTVLRAVEGTLAPVTCLETKTNECLQEPYCATVEVWKQLQVAIDGVVDNLTLADLVKIQKEKSAHDYVI